MTRAPSSFAERVLAAFIFVLLVFPCLHASPAIGDEGLTEILDGILGRYGGLPGLAVDYQREIVTKSMAMLGESMKGDSASGKIYFRPPHFLSVKQTKPRPETLTTDGQTLWWYIPEKKLVYQYPSKSLGRELFLLGDIFQGLGSVGDSFDVIQSDLGDQKEYHLRLVPDPPWEEIDHIDLTVDKSRFDIRVVEVHNTIGNITRFLLSGLSERDDLDVDFFKFRVPNGVRVIKEE
jgi:outer membrane lipoprotein-sorting protein